MSSANVNAAIATAHGFIVPAAPHRTLRASPRTRPALRDLQAKEVAELVRAMITAMPDVNPVISGCGMNLMSVPSLNTPEQNENDTGHERGAASPDTP